MTLHEAIVFVLKKNGQPMTAREIADVVNKENLYSRGDGNDVPSAQISARVKNYPQLFAKENGKIKLLNQ